MLQCLVDSGFVIGLMMLGRWLESINGKHGLVDELLTPLPLGCFGIGLMFLGKVRRVKIADAIGGALIVAGVAMTLFIYLAAHGQRSDAQAVTIERVPSHPNGWH